MKVVLVLVLLGLAVTLIDAEPTEGSECYTDPKARDYRGVVAVTVSGRACQKWTATTPHEASMPVPDKAKGLGDHNYCRNPGNSDTAWCYTAFRSTRWEYCDIPKPSTSCVGSDCDNIESAYECNMISRDCNHNVWGEKNRRECPKTCSACPAKREDTLESLMRRYLESREKMAE